MGLRRDLIAVGGFSHVVLVDPRRRHPLASIAELHSPDPKQGVRSVNFRDDILSFGTGQGKIAFYDIRASQFLPTSEPEHTTKIAANPSLDPSPPAEAGSRLWLDGPTEMAAEGFLGGDGDGFGPHPDAPQDYWQMGRGWIQVNETYLNYFGGVEVRQACYAHAWDPTGRRVFACGGPLSFGLKGGYMALWQ